MAVAVGAPCVARARSRLSAARSSPPLKRERAECSPSSKLITRAALSARRLSRRGLGLCLCRRVKFTTALPLGVSLSQTPHHRAQDDTRSQQQQTSKKFQEEEVQASQDNWHA